MKKNPLLILPYFIIGISLYGCKNKIPTEYTVTNEIANIYPDYSNVTIPPNIAPLHFMVDDSAEAYTTRFISNSYEWIGNGQKAKPSIKEWRSLIESAKGKAITVEIYTRNNGKWKRYKPFEIYVANEDIDPYLSYRLISPSYVTYKDLTINQRNLTNFDESVIYGNMTNTTVERGQCINCHSYQNYDPKRMQFHVREGYACTVIDYDGKFKKVSAKTDSVISAGVYPAWHPQLKLIAYSVNNTGQTFHTIDPQKVEVQDMASDLILFDIEKNEVTRIKGDTNEMECYPWWSPDGQYLYYSSAHYTRRDTGRIERELILNYKDVRYDIYRRRFNQETMQLDTAEMVFNASSLGKSATLPRISPDGKYLLFSMAEYGVFHIWHTDADLYVTELSTMQTRPLKEANSDNVESYHSWSSNGRWIVFSSRRTDGNFTRPFIAYFDHEGKTRKAFELPQDDPDLHRQLMKSYNIPEFMKGPVETSPQTFAAFIRKGTIRPAKQKN